jgi:hypothetical protein
LCNRHGLTVRVCHYPPGASKWNPIEHRLFSEISKNWSGKPLKSYGTVLKYIRTTTTDRGLNVKAHFVRKKYHTGERVSNKQMKQFRLGRMSGRRKSRIFFPPIVDWGNKVKKEDQAFLERMSRP